MLLAIHSTFWLATTLCIFSAFIWLILAYLASRSGTKWFNVNSWGQRISEGESKERFPITKTGFWPLFWVHLFAGTVIYILIASDFWDTWFN